MTEENYLGGKALLDASRSRRQRKDGHMNDPLAGLPAGSLEPALRASLDMAVARRAAQENDRQKREVKLCLTVYRHSAFAIESLAQAIAWPRISRKNLEVAMEEIKVAMEASRELDPEPESA